MTYEQATYYKLLLICGYRDELDLFIDDSLSADAPIPDIILELVSNRSDNPAALTKLNCYIRKAPDTPVDYNEVFRLILSFLQKEYFEKQLPIEQMSDLMYKISIASEKYHEEPWQSMCSFKDYYKEAKDGILDMRSFEKAFFEFVKGGTPIFGHTEPPVKHLKILTWLKKGMRRNR